MTGKGLFTVETATDGSVWLTRSGHTQPGVYLVDLDITSGSLTTLEQIQLALSAPPHLLDQYNAEIQAALTTRGRKAELDLLHVQGLLFSTTPEFSIKATLFNTQSAISQFILLTSVVLLIILSLFSCCICLLVRRKCSAPCSDMTRKKCKAESGSSSSSSKQLNVSDTSSKFDEEGGFGQVRIDQSSEKSMEERDQKPIFISADKVNRYLEGLSSIGSNDGIITVDEQQMRNIQSPPTSLSSLEDSTKKSNGHGASQGTSKESSSSLSCISDEGCYGSSDFSSESHKCQLKVAKQQQQQQQTFFSPQQSNYIRNLSRFEKIYNNRQEPVESASFSSDASYAAHVNQQVVAAISGSYV